MTQSTVALFYMLMVPRLTLTLISQSQEPLIVCRNQHSSLASLGAWRLEDRVHLVLIIAFSQRPQCKCRKTITGMKRRNQGFMSLTLPTLVDVFFNVHHDPSPLFLISLQQEDYADAPSHHSYPQRIHPKPFCFSPDILNSTRCLRCFTWN